MPNLNIWTERKKLFGGKNKWDCLKMKLKRFDNSDFQITDGMASIDMRVPQLGYALRRWSVDCTTDHGLGCKEHHLWLRVHQTLYGVEIAALASGYNITDDSDR